MATVELPFGRRIQKAHENYAEGSSLSFLGRMAKDFITSDFEKSLISSYKDELKDKYTGRGVPEVSPKDLPSEAFVYTPMRENHHLRLLWVERNTSGPLRCTLRDFAREDAPPYIALSYVWSDLGGSQFERDFRETKTSVPQFKYSDGATIVVNDQSFLVGANLYEALHGLRSHTEGRPIWIDAICINQQDLVEKSEQVARIGDVYISAETVFIWLGRRTSARTVPLRIISSWPPFPRDPENESIKYNGKTWPNAMEFFISSMGPSGMGSWAAIISLMTDGWWSRVWTMQEYILAKDYAFFYNGQHIPSEDLEKAMKWTYFMAHGFQRGLYPAWLNLQPSIFDLKRREQPLDLLDSAILSATRIATDPRDKLYAVLSITSPESLGTPEIRPDYTNRDVGKTYITLAQRLIQGNAGLLSLSLVQHPLSPDRDVRKPLLTILREKRRQKQAEKRLPPPSKPELAPPKEDIFDPNMQVDWEDTGNTSFPSWVPKLMATIAVPPLFLKELEAQRALGQPLYDPSWRIFHAASALDGPLSLSPDGNYLSIQISVIDKIRHTASFEKKEGSVSWPSVDTWWKTVRSWFPRNSRLADVAYYPAPSSSVPTALWRTIIANIWLTTHPALPECYEYFGGFLANARDEEAPVDDIKEDLDLPKKPSRMKGDVFGDVMCHVALERSTFVTQGGYLGLGPERAKAGDRVVLVRGAHMPFVMRKTNSGRYLLVGEAYVHGTMYGELAEMVTFKDAEIA